MLENLKDKEILILGFGREGQDTFKFLRKLFPEKTIGIADKVELKKIDKKAQRLIKSSKGRISVKLYLGENYLKSLKKYDVIIKSPGIPPKVIAPFVSKGQKITSQTEIFFENWPPKQSKGWEMKASSKGGKLHRPGKIVGITGTKGKSTTASLIYKILRQGRIRAHLIGNIGKPVLSSLITAREGDVYVYELSSHQLYNLKKSPQVAIFLNIFPEHLDYYRSFREYVAAKANIARYQNKKDYLIFNSGDKLVSKIARKSKAKKVPIKGKYYELDKTAARAAGKIFKIPEKIIQKAIREFKPLPHRLELVGTFRGITFYNDALSTIPETAILAMETLGKRVQTIILGGFDRKIDFKKLAENVLKKRNIKNIILFPTTGEKIWKEILRQAQNKSQGREVPRHFFVDNMPEAVKLAYQHTERGKICLLSCASTSFSIFRDYKEKGNLFKKQVFAQQKRRWR